jgi:hypothetical protein
MPTRFDPSAWIKTGSNVKLNELLFRLPYLWAALIIITFVVVAVATVKVRSNASSSASIPTRSQERPKPVEFCQLIRVWVHRNELTPDLIYARPGKIILRAENETGEDIALAVERVNPGQSNQKEAEIRTSNKAKRVDKEVNLRNGEYVYFVPSRPSLAGKIIVLQDN